MGVDHTNAADLAAEPGGGASPSPAEPHLAPLSEVPLEVTIRLGQTRLPLGDLLALRPGAVLGLAKQVGDPAEVMVGDRVVALGQMVMVGSELAIRITELGQGIGPER
jgi:flagellar motor switch protein FliN